MEIPNAYDVIVIGSGISGGWAAMEFCKVGLKTLLLDRGRNVEHVKDYPTAFKNPWDFKNKLYPNYHDAIKNPIQSAVSSEDNEHFFVQDKEQPYIQEKPFYWIRGNQVGGKSLMWGRQCYRWSDLDFSANEREGIAVDWPIRYKDLEDWYKYVERFIGVSGKAEGLQQLPDSEFLPPFDLNCIEEHIAQCLKEQYKDRLLTIARVANLTTRYMDRGPCMRRNECSRGCPFTGYFSSNGVTIPAAMETGNLTLRPYSVVSQLIYNEETAKVSGVEVIDALTKEVFHYHSRVVFLNASTIASTAILLNSRSGRFPNGLGNDSGQLGRNLMDHHSSAGAYGMHEGYKDRYYKGRRPCGFLIPRFRNLDERSSTFLRGYNIQGHGERMEWSDSYQHLSAFGVDFKKGLTEPGPWTVWMAGWGECLPYEDNRVTLSDSEFDKWGLPLVKIDFSFRENETKMMQDIQETSVDILKTSGFERIEGFNYRKPGGTTIHEMGTARMGRDPKTSVLNAFNQIHAVKNVFVTDGSCMTSSACQNPSLTYMALTARACAFAAGEMKNLNL